MKLIANWRIDRGGASIAAEESFDASDQEAEALLAAGAARKPGKAAATPASGAKARPEDPAALTAEIQAAAKQMLAEDEKQANEIWWTKAGLPRAKAMSDRLYAVTADEIAQALEEK